MEIWWKFLYDAHASRVLPWFFPDTKKRIFSDLLQDSTILFCINSLDVIANRQLSNEDIDYQDYVIAMLIDIKKLLWVKAKVVVNRIQKQQWEIEKFISDLKNKWYEVFKRYEIKWYPDVNKVLSKDWFGQDEYIRCESPLVLVTWAASNSGKMSACMWQLYLDHARGVESGYAKYETFPMWNLDLNHPINLAYEAATADIGDYNCIDTFHLKVYGERVVNYNRDVAAFPLIKGLTDKIVWKDNFMHQYRSPTDMGISMWWFCLTDESVVKQACVDEIERRKKWYQEMIARGEWDIEWLKVCDRLKQKCLWYQTK